MGENFISTISIVVKKIIIHVTCKTLKTWILSFNFSRSGKCLEFIQKVREKTGSWTQNLGKKTCILWMFFWDSLSGCHLQKIFWCPSLLYLHYQHKHLGFHCFYLENTWIFVPPEKYNKTSKVLYLKKINLCFYQNAFIKVFWGSWCTTQSEDLTMGYASVLMCLGKMAVSCNGKYLSEWTLCVAPTLVLKVLPVTLTRNC